MLMTHFGKNEEEAKDFLLNHTLVVNRLLLAIQIGGTTKIHATITISFVNIATRLSVF